MGGAGSPCQSQPQDNQGQDQGAERKGCREGAQTFLHTSQRGLPMCQGDVWLPVHKSDWALLSTSAGSQTASTLIKRHVNLDVMGATHAADA